MINSRFGFALATAGVLAFSGCASGGGGGGSGAAGDAPGDNDYTRSAELFLTQAASLGMVERYQDALDAAMNSIADDSTNARGYFLAARAQIGLADYAAANEMFDEALALFPGYEQDVRVEREQAWITLFNDAIGPLDAGDHEEGIRLLESAEVIYGGKRPEALINLAVTYNNAGRPEDAVDAYGSALEVIRAPGAEADSATVANWIEREQSVAFNRAMLLSTLERYDEAVDEYQTYLASHPDDMSALSSLASVLAQSGQPDSAQAIYDNLLTATGLGMRELMNIGVGLYQAEVYDKAAEAFRRVVEVAPENRDAVFNLAQSLYEGEEWEALVSVGEDLVELDGYNYDSYLILSRALLMSGEGETAQEIYEAGEGLIFQIANSQLQPRPGGGATIVGELVNNALDAGTTVTIRVHFNAEDGAEIGTTDVRVTAPDPDMAEAFRVDFSSDEEVIGYYYEVISP